MDCSKRQAIAPAFGQLGSEPAWIHRHPADERRPRQDRGLDVFLDLLQQAQRLGGACGRDGSWAATR